MGVTMTLRIAVSVAVFALAACSGGGSNPGTASVGGTGAVQPDAVAPHAAAATATAKPKPTAMPTPAASATPSVLVHSGTHGAAMSRLILGMNMAAWVDITEPGLSQAITNIAYTATRWPGGSESDQYHWATNSSCSGGYTATNSTFDNFEKDVAKPANLDVAITLNYGSNAACNGGGDPTEAAAWVAHAKANDDDVKYWTVGNEEYGSWEYDLHAKKNDPTTYASAVATGYYPDVKAADSNAQVGVVVDADSSWDTIVLKNAKYDFVELHYYFTGPGQENDQTLLQQGASGLTAQVNVVKSELAAAGRPNTPIYLGEIGSVYSNPGKQSMSIVQGLFTGMVLGELMNDGVFRGTWWLGFGGCSDASSGANFSSSIYGWQNFGGYMTMSDGTPEYGCSNAPAVPLGTPFPTARAYSLMTHVSRTGEHTDAVSLNPSLTNVRAYAASHATGYAVVLFNLSETTAYNVQVGVDGMTSGSNATMETYGKAQYDESQHNVWAGPIYHVTGKWQGTIPETLAPWSMNVVLLYQ
jgi:hypothetical protein